MHIPFPPSGIASVPAPSAATEETDRFEILIAASSEARKAALQEWALPNLRRLRAYVDAQLESSHPIGAGQNTILNHQNLLALLDKLIARLARVEYKTGAAEKPLL